ncbi:unnamed protein product [Brassica rapa]|uniref:Uncharacterized protein n=2 Tax=Brassica TaxID=3705 RepID=A0A8D9HAY6_BRACM|nr:unnamed protein product [Brassica napus]CAG7896384.1 unnamed protein product [Brassica rapa]
MNGCLILLLSRNWSDHQIGFPQQTKQFLGLIFLLCFAVLSYSFLARNSQISMVTATT